MLKEDTCSLCLMGKKYAGLCICIYLLCRVAFQSWSIGVVVAGEAGTWTAAVSAVINQCRAVSLGEPGGEVSSKLCWARQEEMTAGRGTIDLRCLRCTTSLKRKSTGRKGVPDIARGRRCRGNRSQAMGKMGNLECIPLLDPRQTAAWQLARCIRCSRPRWRTGLIR